MTTARLVLVWTTASLLAGSTAAAQEHATPGEGHDALGLDVENHLAVHPGRIGHSAPSVAIDVVSAHYHGLEPMAFAAELPVAGFGVPGARDEDHGLRIGNPVIELGFVTHAGDLELGIGLGATLPFAHADDEMQHFAYELADAVDAGWDMWAWMPDHFALLLPVEIGYRHDRVALEGELGAGYLIATGDHGEDELVLQARLGAGYSLAAPFAAGLRAQVVWRATAAEDEDAAQLAVMPFLRLAEDAVFAELAVMIPLDAPYGFIGHGEELWSVHIGVGLGF